MNNKIPLVSTALLLFFSFPSISMEKYPIEKYQYDCKQILKKHNEKLTTYKLKPFSENLEQETTTILKKLISYKNNLVAQKEEAFNAIKQHHQIDDTSWESCIETIKDIEEFYKDSKHLPLSNVQHDSTIPKDQLLLITEKLTSYNVNPLRVNIKATKNNQENLLYKSEPIIPSNIVKAYPGCSNDKNSYAYKLLLENVIPGKITINLNLLSSLDMYSQGALCIRMVEDIVNYNSLYSVVFSCVLEDKSHAIINSLQFKIFENICQKLSIFLPSLGNPSIATCMLQLNVNCYTSEFTAYDYNLLSKIESNWRMLLWLKQKQEKTKKNII